MVEKYSENVSSKVATEYLEVIEKIENNQYKEIIESSLLKAAADHLNDIGHKYSSIETAEGERIRLKPNSDEEGGDTLTLDSLRDIADMK